MNPDEDEQHVPQKWEQSGYFRTRMATPEETATLAELEQRFEELYTWIEDRSGDATHVARALQDAKSRASRAILGLR